MANLFPLFLKLEGRRCLLVGAGKIAEQKLHGLLDSGADIHVIAPEATERIRELANRKQIQWRQKRFTSDDLDNAVLVVTATGDPIVNEQVFQIAQSLGILCNSVDEPERCNFYYPSVVKRGDLQIAISTNGKSPALAQRIRLELEKQFDRSYAEWLQWLGSVREMFFQRPIDPSNRTRALHKIASATVHERFRASRQKRVNHG